MLRGNVLQRLWPFKKASSTASVPIATLAIDGLPDAIDALPTGCNVGLWGQKMRPMEIWQQSILSELLLQAPVFLLASNAAQAQMFVEQIHAHAALKSGHLTIWLLEEDTQIKIVKEQGIIDFLFELRAAGLTKNHGFLCLDIFPLIKNSDLKQLSIFCRLMKKWSKKRTQPSVWFLQHQEEFHTTIEHFNFLSQAFPYAATLQLDRVGMHLLLNRWNGKQGAIFQTKFGIDNSKSFDEDNKKLKTNGSAVYETGNRQTIVASDINTIFTTIACVEGIRLLPPEWVVLPGWTELEAACKNSIAATVLIDAGSPNQIKMLGHLVHRLRNSHPSSFKIVIKETTDRLRIHTEEAFSQLGVNTVIHKDNQFSRIVRRLHELQHTWYHGKTSNNVEEVFENLEPLADCGYKEPEKFCSILEDFLNNPARASLNHSLVRLNLLPSVSHLMALKELKLNRTGELFTNNNLGIIIFLYACREADMDKVLMRIFKQPLENFFDSQESFHSIDDMLYEIRKTKISLQKYSLPDYTSFLGDSEIKEENIKNKNIIPAENTHINIPSSNNIQNNKVRDIKRTVWFKSKLNI